ncbi:PREDICTED: pentatricopeptide repeat-containing protein At2g41080-like [Camelina sativa]|uniref:Pentatricopeptide repeat-containing protein At2g41080-like n=1 Tax=Camelina sativa TaxID=90675 RepID=A0ABM0ZLX7_CAMSA|nr:PREDICTED: pentatricopeptide repeat-containing protein At2g41080-like [Camelina sativa]XP_010517594.1 PREDICTED: pentatricopeptide repeat-containing protein At2g41080-like [Camelina sativa]
MHCSVSSVVRPLSADPATAIATLCSKGNLREAFQRFRLNIFTNTSLFTPFIQSCTTRQSLPSGKQLHCLLVVSGFSSDKFICNHLMSMYSKLGDFPSAVALYGRMPKKNYMSSNILINGYVRAGDLLSARNVFDEMPDRKLTTWNAMIAGLIQFECNEEGLSLFRDMHGLGFWPDEYTLGSVFSGSAGLRSVFIGQQIHGYTIKYGLELDLVVNSSLAHMYMRNGKLRDGEIVIRSMPVRNLVAWNTLIMGNAQNGCPETVLYLYKMMKISGCRPNKITFVTVLSSCSDLAIRGQGQQIHAEAIKIGASSVVAVVSSLISMYSKCGCLEDAAKAFSEREDEDEVMWSSMISAYGFHGQGDVAIKLFNTMVEKTEMEINEVAFLNLLYACSHSGLKDKGLELFDMMVEKYGFKPGLKHYTCVVDLLGRAGSLDQAEAKIRSMPIKPDTIIWKTLLSACNLHKNTEMAQRVFQEILQIDPNDSACYVLLANVHASAKRWRDVSEVRKLMRDKNVKKEAGISWFEHKGEVYHFKMGDRSQSTSKEIYSYLKELTQEMKLKGYKPDTASVLHDMDEEEKESDLVQHSEKLAVAYALMILPEGVPIRIIKNLRVCSDCHVAFKYISVIKKREITLRDGSRFHHFINGKCSCSDYW